MRRREARTLPQAAAARASSPAGERVRYPPVGPGAGVSPFTLGPEGLRRRGNLSPGGGQTRTPRGAPRSAAHWASAPSRPPRGRPAPPRAEPFLGPAPTSAPLLPLALRRGVRKPLPLARFLQAPAVATPLRVLPPQACASPPCRWTTPASGPGASRVRAGMRGGNGLGWTEGENALCAAFILLVAAPPPQDGWGSGVAGARRPTPSRLPSPQPLPHATLSFPIP